MSRRTELEQFIIREAVARDGVPTLIRMGADPGRPRMKERNRALMELEQLLQGEPALDRRFAYAIYALAYYVTINIDSWIHEGRKWPSELVDDEFHELLMHIEYLFDGDLFEDEINDES